MELRKGWLQRQFDRVDRDIADWPEYMRREVGFMKFPYTADQKPEGYYVPCEYVPDYSIVVALKTRIKILEAELESSRAQHLATQALYTELIRKTGMGDFKA